LNSIEGRAAQRLAFAIVAARFNELICSPLLDGAVNALRRSGVSESQIDVVRVPGALEIPLMCQKLAASKRFAGVIAVGCVIRGATYHFDVVAQQSAAGDQCDSDRRQHGASL
jgi:6,7-dimethyl-8-ribityllumazine synthase